MQALPAVVTFYAVNFAVHALGAPLIVCALFSGPSSALLASANKCIDTQIVFQTEERGRLARCAVQLRVALAIGVAVRLRSQASWGSKSGMRHTGVCLLAF